MHALPRPIMVTKAFIVLNYCVGRPPLVKDAQEWTLETENLAGWTRLDSQVGGGCVAEDVVSSTEIVSRSI